MMKVVLKFFLFLCVYGGWIVSTSATMPRDGDEQNVGFASAGSSKPSVSQSFVSQSVDQKTSALARDLTAESKEQKLNQIISLRGCFKKGFFEITPETYRDILIYVDSYQAAFATYDRGVSLRGWSEKDDVKGLLKLLYYFNAVKSVKCRKNAWQGKTLVNSLGDAIQHYESLEALDLKDSVLNDKETIKLLKVLPNPASLKLLNIKASILSSQAQSEIKKKHPNLAEFIVESETKELVVKQESKAVKAAPIPAAVIKTDEQKTPAPLSPATAQEVQAPVMNTAPLKTTDPNNNTEEKPKALPLSQPSKKVTNEDILDALNKVNEKTLSIDDLAALINSDPTFTSLRLFDKKIGDEGVKALAIALQGNTSLEILELGWNRIGVEGGKALAIALQGNTSLGILKLGSNTIGNEGGKALAAALQGNTSLQQLDLQDNTIGDEGGKALAIALKGNTSLQQLYLSSNSIGDEGVKALTQALKGNTSLEMLDLGGNTSGDEGVKALAIALKGNTSIKELYLSRNEIGEECKGILQKLKESNPKLYIGFN